jgi:hypothetical protein
MAHDVFVSHSSKDKVTADAVCAVLESHGHRCWIAPRDILPGRDWGKSIIQAIKGARVMVLIFSAHANTSPQITREVERAVSLGIPIIPLRIENVPPVDTLEYFISSPHWLDAFPPPLDRHLEYLAKVVTELLALGAEATTSGASEAEARQKVQEEQGRLAEEKRRAAEQEAQAAEEERKAAEAAHRRRQAEEKEEQAKAAREEEARQAAEAKAAAEMQKAAEKAEATRRAEQERAAATARLAEEERRRNEKSEAPAKPKAPGPGEVNPVPEKKAPAAPSNKGRVAVLAVLLLAVVFYVLWLQVQRKAEHEARGRTEQQTLGEAQARAEVDATARMAAEHERATALAELERERRTRRDLEAELVKLRVAARSLGDKFATNRILASFKGVRVGALGGEIEVEKEAQTILFSDGTQAYTLFHLSRTQFGSQKTGGEWKSLTAVLERSQVAFSGVRLSFLAQDPRVVVVPIGSRQADMLGASIFKLASLTNRNVEAVIVSLSDDAAADCTLAIDPGLLRYGQVNRKSIRWRLPQTVHNLSAGDLVFSTSDELIGILVNTDYCAILTSVVPAKTIQLGSDTLSQQPGTVLAETLQRIQELPEKLK